MTKFEIAHQRLHNQLITQHTFDKPADVVQWLGALQAQDYAGAKWAIGQRMHGIMDATIEQALTDGTILRTHLLRPTWHFVAPADIRWLLALTAPRVNAANAYYYRKFELDAALFLRSHAAIANALQGGRQLTRLELAAILEQEGIVAAELRLSYIMMRAELDGLICSGARRGKQFTYTLLEERVSPARKVEPDRALAELTRRYFTSRGPAKVQDFVGWSGLTVADAKAGLAMTKPQIIEETIGGEIYWRAAASPAIEVTTSPTALLLPPYDEYAMAYNDHSAMLDPAHVQQARAATYGGIVVIDCQVVGNWKRTFNKGATLIESAPFRPFNVAEKDAFAAAAQRYGKFLGMPVVLA